MILFGIIFGTLITLIVIVCYIIAIAFTLWMIVDAGKQDRFWWLTIIIGVPVIGPIAYYFTEKKHEYTRVPAHHIHESLTERQHESSPQKKYSKNIKKENVSEVVATQREESHQEELVILEQDKGDTVKVLE